MTHSIIVFDLDDTLTESKTNITEEAARLLHGLLAESIYEDEDPEDPPEHIGYKYQVGILSGCAYEQFNKQVIKPMFKYCELNDAWGRDIWADHILSHLYLMPASGSQLYTYKAHQGGWNCQYKDSLNLRSKYEIVDAFDTACELTDIHPPAKIYGEVEEDRDSQITFSFCGQEAPLEVKKKWDPDKWLRLRVAKTMRESLKGSFDVTVGGSTSIDVTLAGRDKAYGMTKFLEFMNAKKEDVLFVADALFPEGNDYPVKQMGIESKSVSGPEDTIEIMKSLLGE